MAQTVVVVDDDEGVREAMVDLLESDGFVVLTARDGDDALRVLREAPRPCVAVIDLVMPGIDGWQLMRAMTEEPALADIAVVCCTAGRAAAPAGCAALLRKPFEADALVEAVRIGFAHKAP